MKIAILSLVSILAIASLVGCSGGGDTSASSPAPGFGSKAAAGAGGGTTGGGQAPSGAPATVNSKDAPP